MHDHQSSKPLLSPLSDTADTILPAASFLRYETRADGWSAGRQAAFLAHLADTGLVADAARSVGMSDKGGYALRRQARGYGFNLGWEAALIIARRIVADNLMAAAIQGETSRWVREEGVTTYTRQNSKLSLALLDRVNPALALPEVLAVVTQFDWFVELIDKGASGEQLWSLFFDATIPHTEHQARARVRASLQLSEESAIFDEMEEEEEEPKTEYKSMDVPPAPVRVDAIIAGSRRGAEARRKGRKRGLGALSPFLPSSAPLREPKRCNLSGARLENLLRGTELQAIPASPRELNNRPADAGRFRLRG